MSFHDTAAQLPADLRAPGLVERRELGEPLCQRARVAARETVLVVEEAVESGIGCEHGQTARRGLEDDLVGRSLAHVVDQEVVLREQGRHRASRYGAVD